MAADKRQAACSMEKPSTRCSCFTFRLTPLGLFLDLWACHKQFLEIEKVGWVLSIDDVVP